MDVLQQAQGAIPLSEIIDYHQEAGTVDAFYHFNLPLYVFDERCLGNFHPEAGGWHALLFAQIHKHFGHIDVVKVGGVHIDGNESR